MTTRSTPRKSPALLHRVLMDDETGRCSARSLRHRHDGAGRLGRHFIGIERENTYINAALKRIAAIKPYDSASIETTTPKRSAPRIPFGSLIEQGLIAPGTQLFDDRKRYCATVRADGSLVSDGKSGSIHRVGALVQGFDACNGWTFWHLKTGETCPIDEMRGYAQAQRFLPDPDLQSVKIA